MPPRLEFGFGQGTSSDRRTDPTEARPFRILVLADLSGAGTAEHPAAVDPRAMPVDLDNFETRLAAIARPSSWKAPPGPSVRSRISTRTGWSRARKHFLAIGNRWACCAVPKASPG